MRAFVARQRGSPEEPNLHTSPFNELFLYLYVLDLFPQIYLLAHRNTTWIDEVLF